MYLGIDIGTSSVKVVLIDADQRIVASRSEPLSVERPHPGWSEQDPESWVSATSSVIDAICRDHPEPLKRVKGIGLSGHMHGATLLDKAGRPLRPCILWNDGRSEKEAAELDADPRFRQITGNIVFPGFTAPKLVWVHRHEPKIFGKVAQGAAAEGLRAAVAHRRPCLRHVGFRRHALARRGEARLVRAAARGDASGTRPDAEALRGHRADRRCSRKVLATRWGMERPPVIAGGAGDNAASACGVGAVAPGAAFVSLGTSGVLFVSNEKFRPNAASAVHAFCHALPDTWHQMGVILSAAASLEWLAHVTGSTPAGSRRKPPRSPLATGAADLPALPFRRAHAAQRCRRARQLRRPVAPDATGPRLARAVMEGVAFAFARLPGGAEGRRHERRAGDLPSAAARARASG